MQVLGVCEWVSGLARVLALVSWVHVGWAWLVVRSVDVMLAWRVWVRLASGLLLVRSSSHVSLLDVVAPGLDWVSSVASVSADRSAARVDVVGGDRDLSLSVGGDADAVGDGLGGRDGPAGSTGGLVTDLRDRRAFWPLGAGVERVWDGGVVNFRVGLLKNSVLVWDLDHLGSHQLLLDGVRVGAEIRSEFCLERRLFLVDVVDKLLSAEHLSLDRDGVSMVDLDSVGVDGDEADEKGG